MHSLPTPHPPNERTQLFGADFEDSGYSITNIGNLDSDGDGYFQRKRAVSRHLSRRSQIVLWSNPSQELEIGIDVIIFLANSAVAAVVVVKFVILRR